MMQTGAEKHGMQTLNQSLANLYRRRLVTLETAMSISSNEEELKDLIGRKSPSAGVEAGIGGTIKRFQDGAVVGGRREG
jgi:twitching motility protein PilT